MDSMSPPSRFSHHHSNGNRFSIRENDTDTAFSLRSSSRMDSMILKRNSPDSTGDKGKLLSVQELSDLMKKAQSESRQDSLNALETIANNSGLPFHYQWLD